MVGRLNIGCTCSTINFKIEVAKSIKFYDLASNKTRKILTKTIILSQKRPLQTSF